MTAQLAAAPPSQDTGGPPPPPGGGGSRSQIVPQPSPVRSSANAYADGLQNAPRVVPGSAEAAQKTSSTSKGGERMARWVTRGLAYRLSTLHRTGTRTSLMRRRSRTSRPPARRGVGCPVDGPLTDTDQDHGLLTCEVNPDGQNKVEIL